MGIENAMSWHDFTFNQNSGNFGDMYERIIDF